MRRWGVGLACNQLTLEPMTISNMFRRTIEAPVENGQGLKLMDSQKSPAGTAPPRQADESTGAPVFADTMVWAWKDIKVVLVPIVGERGVAALYNRSLHLTAKAFPWLTALPTDIQAAIDLDALHALLSRQDTATATAGGGALFRTFHDLLSSLIGPSLTERLLLPVWEKYLSAPSAQDPSP